jgi:Ca-activated chloride channel family protein
MLSPVVVGVRKSAADRLGWGGGAKVGWHDIAKAAAAGQFHFAMTSAAASNSGFSALVGLASALAGGQALDTATVDAAGVRGFFTGQALTAGSSGFLSDAYVRDQDRLDGMVNYESVLMALNASGKLHDPLVLVYPSEGIVTADYPLMLLNSGSRGAYGKLVDYLRRPAVQRKIEQVTFRRPAVPGVPLEGGFPSGLLVEAPFPANLAVVRRLLDDYQTQLRRPAHTVYVLDLSGSMGGDRLDRLKAALAGLAGADTSFTGHFARFAPREKVTLVTFSDDVIDTKNFDVDSSDPNSAGLVAVRQTVGGFQAGGNTAIYTALQHAYQVAATARTNDAGSFVSIVLMTDGENNRGVTSEEFLRGVRALPPDQAGIHVYAVLFGGADPKALQAVADATGGRVFDARTADLAGVFKEIRGYQ